MKDYSKLTAADVHLTLNIEGVKFEGEIVELGEKVPLAAFDYRSQLSPVIEKNLKGFSDSLKEKTGSPLSYDESIVVLSYMQWMLGLDPE